MLTVQAQNLIRQRPDLDDTITRQQDFDEAGADVLYASRLKTLDMVRTVCSSISKPVNLLLGGSTDMTVMGVTEAGAKRINVGGGLTRKAYDQMIKVARRIAEDGVFDHEDSPGKGGVGKLM